MRVTAHQVRAINSISRKVSFSQSQLSRYFRGIVTGENENKLLAEALDAPEGADSLQFLTSMFSAVELTELKQALHEMNPLKPTVSEKPAPTRSRNRRVR
jgi:hypothetical protein